MKNAKLFIAISICCQWARAQEEPWDPHHCRVPTSFVHPGILYTLAEVEQYRTHALSGDAPWAATYQDLLKDEYSNSSYKMQGPEPIIGRNTGNTTITGWSNKFQSDARAVLLNALVYSITRDTANAEKVVEIVDAWSVTLQEVVSDDNILAALSGRQFANGAELVRYLAGSWPSGESNFQRAQAMVNNALLPYVYAAGAPATPAPGGNQAFLGHMAGLEFAIFTNNYTGYAAELGIILQPKNACVGTEGSGLQALILNTTGQCAEAGRDQGHSADEVGWMEEAAQVAANQGDTAVFDVLSQDGSETPLLLLALEYYFKYNTGSNVPFDINFGPCCCGTILYPKISNITRGTHYPIGEIGYRYYHTEHGHAAPYTELWLQDTRPLETSSNDRDFMGYPTLTWAAGPV